MEGLRRVVEGYEVDEGDIIEGYVKGDIQIGRGGEQILWEQNGWPV